MHENVLALSTALVIAASGGASVTARAADDVAWVVDHASARVVADDPFERGPDGGMLGDRILFDLTSGEQRATLVLSCAQQSYRLEVEGQHLLHEGPTSDWSLAAQLAEHYCAKIADLPAANALMPI